MRSNNFESYIHEIYQTISNTWDNDIIPQLMKYIKIPNKSVSYDANWKIHGYMDEAMNLLMHWCQRQSIRGMQLEIIQLPKRTPLLFIEISGTIDETVLLYGHMDKQPEMAGWNKGLGPWKPVLKGNKLYGRGGADDGYAVFASLTTIAALQQYRIPHARCIIIIEGSEESGSIDLPDYLKHLNNRIGNPSLVICLDSGCINYDQLWCTTSLRGLIGGELKIKVLKNGIHSGTGSGIVPSPFSILRQLLDRIEESTTGVVILKELKVSIPTYHKEQAEKVARTLRNSSIQSILPLLPNVEPITHNVTELLLNRTWRPQLSIIGIDGLPTAKNAGNVSIPFLKVILSMRLPPTIDAQKASIVLKNTLEKDPAYHAKISFSPKFSSNGWVSPSLSHWLSVASKTASQQFFGKPSAYFGEGGTIPFMKMLGEMFPNTQFMITGLLGPKSNAHGPNECLDISTGKKLTACVAWVIAAHYKHYNLR
ncbi:M20/M25/M40 family metallo-hydrolase [Coxiella endosymbiont of Amblyomma americanum]|uniref:M20/M25/M40 family metallo-hydrolase n=1 Tax=Coxiella endosymbiont of Amblyomma americanum TaxID=325775 RepID=UPI00058224A6|nr:M20/M25/M40 family metallo-hydrolase [Coxiella endosymbiont of Amblyomma americanum]AJC50385.1 peptidase M20 [Coxiella endosymbiont of Amblyomma americanum]AUJ58727.1 peptidase M20 [Coxiella-like endosymbiont of Amblyomma americanum]